LSFVSLVRGFTARKTAPVSFQKAVVEVTSSMAAIAIWLLSVEFVEGK
jgi:hypothetical protein